jgi:hypothetical protein
MPIVISIPTPCHEDWNKMTAKDQGRHCDICNKTVVDFTTWQPQQILLHFKTNTNVCGKFRTDQLDEPIPTKEDFVNQISYFKIPFIKKTAAIFLFVFAIMGNGFKAEAQGAPILKHSDSLMAKSNIVGGNTIVKFKCRIPLKVTNKTNTFKNSKRKHKSYKGKLTAKQDEFPTLVGYTISKPIK